MATTFTILTLFLMSLLCPVLCKDIGEYKNCSSPEYKGVYCQDCFIRCCKGERIFSMEDDIQWYIIGKDDCRENLTRDNPKDDFVTLMWKIHACHLRKVLQEGHKLLLDDAEIDFKTFVTASYPEVIQTASKECKEGDKATDILDKLAKYVQCVREYEYQACHEPSAEVQATWNNDFVPISALESTSNSKVETCPETHGIWDKEDRCCKGKVTPTSWKRSFYFKQYRELLKDTPSAYDECQNSIKSVVESAAKDLLASVNNNSTDSVMLYMYMESYCIQACLINPATFWNGTAPVINFDFNAGIDFALSFYNEAVKETFKALALKHKSSKHHLAFYYLQNGRSLATLDEMAEGYSKETEPLMKLKYYCSYYHAIGTYSDGPMYEYCLAEEAVQLFFKRIAGL